MNRAVAVLQGTKQRIEQQLAEATAERDSLTSRRRDSAGRVTELEADLAEIEAALELIVPAPPA